MKAKTQFIKMFKKLPENARKDLVFGAYSDKPMSLNVIYMEVQNDTVLSILLLKTLGFIDSQTKQEASKWVKMNKEENIESGSYYSGTGVGTILSPLLIYLIYWWGVKLGYLEINALLMAIISNTLFGVGIIIYGIAQIRNSKLRSKA